MQPKPIEFFQWYAGRSDAWKNRPWLILGKGPSYSLFSQSKAAQFNIFGLNHVVLDAKVDLLHAIDLDVIESCAAVLESNAKYVLMPWYPHVDNRPGKASLEALVEQVPVLESLATQGRLLWYNKAGSPPYEDSPAVPVVYFSAEAPYALLGRAGARTIRSLGIDGGNRYARHFSELSTLLSNGQANFNRQFKEIARSIMKYRIDAAPLGVESPIRVFVATMEEQMLAVKVLEYSIRKHTSMSVEVVPMHTADIPVPVPKDEANLPRTPFSFQRFLIPQLAGFHGRAIYLDSDMQVFADLRELWSCDMESNQLLSAAASDGGRKPQYSVMLIDCAQLNWKIGEIVEALDRGEYSYEDLMYKMCVADRQKAGISSEWNSLEKYVKGKTKLVHYTDMNTQPWIYARHPFGYLWVRDLLEAIKEGVIEKTEVLDHVRKGWVRPSLEYQVEHGIEDAFILPKPVLDRDNTYSPPYFKLHAHGARPWTNGVAAVKAVIRHVVYRSGGVTILRRIAHRIRS